MKLSTPSYRVAVVGAASLLGKELLAVLEERKFPVSRLVTLGAGDIEPELPILDLGAGLESLNPDPAQVELDRAEQRAAEEDVDFAFLAGRSKQVSSFLSSTGGPGEPAAPVIIDLGGSRAADRAEAAPQDAVLRAPFLERELSSIPIRSVPGTADPAAGSGRLQRYISAHPAAIVIGSLLVRLGARFPVRSAVAQILCPASESGPRGIEELQKQTLNLLSFQKVPQAVFGAQLAFNVLPRLGRARRGGSEPYRDDLTDLEGRIRAQLRAFFLGRIPLPALRVMQVPVFYSLTVSLYVETEQPVDPQLVAEALAGGRVQVRRFRDPAPSQIDVTGTSDILTDAITADGGQPAGIWLWATADNLRLAAVNAVEIAESVKEQGPLPRH